VFINRLDGHEALANAAAMRAAKVTKDTPTPFGGQILRDARGEPTGIFKDQALDLIDRAIPDPAPDVRDSATARALRYAASLGVTAVFACVGVVGRSRELRGQRRACQARRHLTNRRHRPVTIATACTGSSGM